MPQRGSTFELTLWGLRLGVLRSFMWVVVAAGMAGAAPPAANGADAFAPALPPPEAAGVSEWWLAAEPAQQGWAGTTRAPDAIARKLASTPAEPAEAAQPATTAWPAWVASVAGDHDQTFATILVAAALIMIAGSVLWALRWWRAETPSAPKVRPARAGEPTPLVLARTAVRNRRPPGAQDQAAEEVGRPSRLPEHVTPRKDAGGATRPSP